MELERSDFLPQGSQIRKIDIVYMDVRLIGFKLYDQSGAVILKVGDEKLGSSKGCISTEYLAEGERIIGYQSTQYYGH